MRIAASRLDAFNGHDLPRLDRAFRTKSLTQLAGAERLEFPDGLGAVGIGALDFQHRVRIDRAQRDHRPLKRELLRVVELRAHGVMRHGWRPGSHQSGKCQRRDQSSVGHIVSPAVPRM